MAEPWIRSVKIEDAPAIAQIDREALGYGTKAEEAKERLAALLERRQSHLWVAELEEGGAKSIAGYVQACDYITTYHGSGKLVMTLAVHPAWQGRGIGAKLLGTVEEWAWEEGCDAVRLESGTGRHGAHRFYEKQGYAHRKDHRNYVKPL